MTKTLNFIFIFLLLSFSAFSQVSLDYINRYRFECGLLPFVNDSILEKAAYGHALYMDRNKILTHDEIPSKPGFIGKSPADRAVYFGYPTRYVVEDAAWVPSPVDAIDGLMAAPYHRLPLLSFDLDLIGFAGVENYFAMEFSNSFIYDFCSSPNYQIPKGRYYSGVCADKKRKISVITLNQALDNIRKTNPKVVMYPFDGQKDVNIYFANEYPAPVPGCKVNGYPISIFFNPFYIDSVQMIKFIVKDDRGEKIKPAIILSGTNDKNKKLSYTQFFFIPEHILRFNTTYFVKFIARIDGKKQTFSWKFRTEDIPDIIYWTGKMTVQAQEDDLLTVFLVPRDCKDVNFQLSYKYNMDYFFVQSQNMFLYAFKVKGRKGQKAIVSTQDGREIKIVIH